MCVILGDKTLQREREREFQAGDIDKIELWCALRQNKVMANDLSFEDSILGKFPNSASGDIKGVGRRKEQDALSCPINGQC